MTRKYNAREKKKRRVAKKDRQKAQVRENIAKAQSGK